MNTLIFNGLTDECSGKVNRYPVRRAEGDKKRVARTRLACGIKIRGEERKDPRKRSEAGWCCTAYLFASEGKHE
jgi:hypothetical protein